MPETTRRMIGVIPQTGRPVYRDTDGHLTTEPMTDLELSAKISERLDWIEEELPRMRTALMRRFRAFDSRSKTGILSHKAMIELQGSMRVLHEAARALGETPQARAQAKAESELNRVWQKAKTQYHHWASKSRGGTFQAIIPWDMLTEDQKAEWFDRADDRVPPTWRELTPEQKGAYRDTHGIRSLESAEAGAHHERNRQKHLRRKAYRQVQDAVPYKVPRTTEQRMEDVTAHAQNLSWVRAEHAAGRMSDLTLAIQQEHYRRALHAYTRPFEPYEAP